MNRPAIDPNGRGSVARDDQKKTFPGVPAVTIAPSVACSTPRAHIYARIRHGEPASTKEVAAAEDHFRQHLQPLGFLLGKIFVDRSVTGGVALLQRPKGVTLAASLEKGDVVLIVCSATAFAGTRDLARTVALWSTLGVEVHLLDLKLNPGTREGRAALYWMQIFGEIQRSWWRERRRAVVARQKQQGKPVCRWKYGYRIVGPRGKRRWAPDSYTRAVGRKIVEFRRAGWSWHAIYFHFLEQGVRTRDDRELSVGSIQRFYHAELALRAKENGKHSKPEATPS